MFLVPASEGLIELLLMNFLDTSELLVVRFLDLLKFLLVSFVGLLKRRLEAALSFYKLIDQSLTAVSLFELFGRFFDMFSFIASEPLRPA